MDLSIPYRLCVMMLDIKQTIKDRDHDLIANNTYTGLYLLLPLPLGKDMYYYPLKPHKHSYTNRPKILFRSKDYTKERKINTIHTAYDLLLYS